VQRTSFEDLNCSVAQCLESPSANGGASRIVRDTFLGVTRFDDFQTRSGSPATSSQRLNHLVEAGVLHACLSGQPAGSDYD